MRVTILKPNVPSEFGIPFDIGSVVNVSDDYGKSLVRSLQATDTDNVLSALPNDPFLKGRAVSAPITSVPGTSQIARAAARFALKKTNPFGSVFGDSFAAAAGATVTANGYAQMLTADLASQASWSNYGRSGFPLSKYGSAPRISGNGAANASQIPLSMDHVSFGIVGLNDLRGVSQDSVATTGCGPNPDNYSTLRSKVQSMALSFLIPETNKIRMRNIAQTALNTNGITISGTWSQSFAGNSALIYTTNNAQQIIIPKTAVGNLLIVQMARSSTDTTGFTVFIDGVQYPNIACNCSYDSWSADCILINLPNVAAHQVILNSVVSGGAAMIESVSCVDTTRSDFSATLLYGTPLYLNDGSNIGWGLTGITANSASAAGATGGAAWAYGNGACDRFGRAVDSAMDELYALGFNVVKVELKSGWNTSTMISADTIHPNDTGHANLYSKFRNPLRTLFGV